MGIVNLEQCISGSLGKFISFSLAPFKNLLLNMLKIITGILIGILFFAGIYLSNSFGHSNEKVPYETVLVKLTNNSSLEIRTATLKHERGTLKVTNIPKNTHAYLGFPNNYENSYTLTIELENGKILESSQGYFEYGMRVNEIITESKITPVTDNY